MFCGDVVVSNGTGGLISVVWNSFFQGPVGFTYVFCCAVVGWAFPVVDYISFLIIWNWIFWMHEQRLDGAGTFKENSNSVTLSVINTHICIAKHVCSTPEFLAKEMDHLHKVLQDSHYSTQNFQQGKPQQKANKKPNPSTVKFIEGARVVIPYIKGLSE